MKAFVVKYVIVILINVLAGILLSGLYFLFLPFDFNYQLTSWFHKYGIIGYTLILRLVIAILIWKDLKTINPEVNYLIPILVLFNEYYGIAFFLLSIFFNKYKSVNTTSYATENEVIH